MSGSAANRPFLTALLGIAAAAVLLRVVFPLADPPWNPTVGVVWHDEGAWTHNARNRALWGAWTLDAWNPLYIAPVFTGLEYVSFALFGVGLWQARLVSEVAGAASVLCLALGMRRIAGDLAALIAAALLATNYVYVMYNRAAIMEATMVAFMVIGWYCYVRAQDRPAWGLAAGLCALLAFFTKAAAAFFVAALALDAAIAWLLLRETTPPAVRRAALMTLAGLAAGGALALVAFIVPNWADYRFYNWQMSVTRKPSYDLKSLIDRVSWFPVQHDVMTRTWLAVVVATAGALATLARWRAVKPGERLLVLWVGLGTLELLVHDVGNERRYLILIPAVLALAAIVLGGRRAVAGPELTRIRRSQAAIAAPLLAFAFYVMAGSIVRVFNIYEVRPNVRLAAAIAILATAVVYAWWTKVAAWLAAQTWSPRAAVLVAALVCAGDVAQFVQWALGRSYKNYAASVELGRVLPAGTLVHGKLANGLALDNRIRPIFVGREFGNYEDRKRRDDVRYILTYISPSLGYESQARNPIIKDVLDAYPNRRILMTFDVAETPGGRDRAALFDKFGGTPEQQSDRSGRAHD